jgi:hypothetical protein
VIGGLFLPRIRGRVAVDLLVVASTAIFGACLLAISLTLSLSLVVLLSR